MAALRTLAELKQDNSPSILLLEQPSENALQIHEALERIQAGSMATPSGVSEYAEGTPLKLAYLLEAGSPQRLPENRKHDRMLAKAGMARKMGFSIHSYDNRNADASSLEERENMPWLKACMLH